MSAEQIVQKKDPFGALKISEFRNLMIGRFLFIMGLRMMGTLVGWWIYELTNEPFAIGLIGLAEVIPAVSLALYAGHVIDISEKRKLLLKGVALYWICAIALLVLSSKIGTGAFNNLQIAIGIYFVIFCTGIIRSFTGPSFGTLVGEIMPKYLLQNATTWSQGIWLSASVLGHAMVGFFIAGFGNTGSLWIVLGMVTIGFVFISKIKPKPPHKQEVEQKTLESVKEGIRFVVQTKEVLGALSLDLFAVLFGGAVAMIPVFARDILKVGPIGFGWLNAAADIGAILIIFIITIFPVHQQQGKKLLLAVAGFGVCIIVFALSTTFWISFAALLLSGILDGFSMIVRGTIVQLKTPNHMRGRVMSVNSMFINSSNELGQFESGLAARAMGVVPSVVFGGIMTLIVVTTTWFKAPSLRKMEY
ncbi:MAG: MFS transporter [Chitinophagaceae bacterium]|jgi:MFS family permease